MWKNSKTQILKNMKFDKTRKNRIFLEKLVFTELKMWQNLTHLTQIVTTFFLMLQKKEN